jgi:hypothetical protein
MAQLRNKQVVYDSLIQMQSALQIKNVAAGTDASDVVVKSQLDAIESLVNGLEWQDSALDFVTDNTLAPATEVTGHRYVLSDAGGTPHVNWDGAAAGDIVEFDGLVWVATTPTAGTFISVDNETTLLYYYGGASWTTKAFESTTASTGLTQNGIDIQLADANGNGIDITSGSISVDALDGTITVAAGGISVGTITTANFADFAGDVETAVFTAANFVDGTTIDFTVTAGDSVTAEVSDNSLNEDKLLNLGTGTGSTDLVASDGAGGFVYVDSATISGTTPERVKHTASVTASDEDTAVTDVFGAFDPASSTVPQVFVNGILVECGDGTKVSVPCYFAEAGVAGTAIAFSALDGNENLQWNGSIAGYELDASDEVIVQFEV